MATRKRRKSSKKSTKGFIIVKGRKYKKIFFRGNKVFGVTPRGTTHWIGITNKATKFTIRNPWTAAKVHRHNKRCGSKVKCAKKWARIANAILKKTGDEGKAIRIANWQVKRLGLKNPKPKHNKR